MGVSGVNLGMIDSLGNNERLQGWVDRGLSKAGELGHPTQRYYYTGKGRCGDCLTLYTRGRFVWTKNIPESFVSHVEACNEGP
jgi:hypothetical protein